jgi:hypothetical protein
MSGMRCMVLQPFDAKGNQSHLDLWVVTGGPRYLRCIVPIVAPKPYVERANEAVHLTGCRIGTHMLLKAPSRDSVMRPWG